MIRGAGRFAKRMDERANYPTPDTFSGEPGSVIRCGETLYSVYIASIQRAPGLYPSPPDPDRVVPSRVMDGRQLLAPVARC